MPLNNAVDQQKNILRRQYKSLRISLSDDKKMLDNGIFTHIINSEMFIKAKTIVTYVSTDIEVDTFEIISFALDNGKNVAVPKCIEGTRLMDFYFIDSPSDLEIGAFSVLEPVIDRCTKVTDFGSSICLVPGLSFDFNGYRLGYGKGYYDRFLSGYKGTAIGLCYECCLNNSLAVNEYDIAVDFVVTERNIYYTKGGDLCER